MPANSALIRSRLVRSGGSAAESDDEKQRDKEEEESWCADHAKLLESLVNDGIDVSVKAARASGTVPLEAVGDATLRRKGDAQANARGRREVP